MFGFVFALKLRLRSLLVTLIAASTVALTANPAAAATELTDIDKGALAAVVVVGLLLFAIVIEVWRTSSEGPKPASGRARPPLRNPHHHTQIHRGKS